MNILSFDLVNHIMSFVHDYKKDYNLVIKDIINNYTYHPICSTNCLFKTTLFKGNFYPALPLTRHSHRICQECNKDLTSYYYIEVCHSCADQIYYPKDFEHYHSICK